MGKFEIQSMPVQKSENNYICVHSTCKELYFNGGSNVPTQNSNGISKALVNGFQEMGIAQNGLESTDVAEEEDSEEVLDGIPQGMEVLTNQVAGHLINDSGGVGMLKKDGLAFKPLLKKECAEREIKLYEHLDRTVDRSLIEMRQLVPKYHGVQKLKIKDKEIDFLVLEDLTKDFKEPCIMDIKIGRRTWDPHASYNKIIAEQNKYHECKRDLGFCIPGSQVYKIANNQLVKYDNEYGKKLDKDGAREAIKMFLNADTHHFCRKLLVQLLASLWQIQHFARSQRRLKLYATSILLVYDARRLKEHVEVKKPVKQHPRPSLVRHRSLYRPLSLAQLNNGCERVPTGFSGQLTPDGPILKYPCNKIVNMDWPKAVNNNNTWQKSIHTLRRTHSFQNNYDKDVQNKKQSYSYILDDLCSESKSEVWATAKLIDFAHVYLSDSTEVDRNYLDGVENLIKMFEDFLSETEE
ncbi:inositol polyphosphate multikinase [Euwallacea similis]|uniref:inositol polyphosphate multikinase n=1 Tax=Euwallacea similis TaxID=1736056 RepID=UPI00344E7E1D